MYLSVYVSLFACEPIYFLFKLVLYRLNEFLM
uniref:Uncharacterized protein n=1 Tax=Arundo donax TaxID=35708 RepID=A0A0A8ZQJ6_ARUDO